MEDKKPIILIITSHDEKGNVSSNLSNAIKDVGTHNVVIISDDKYSQYGQAKFSKRINEKIVSVYEKYLQKKDDKIKAENNLKKGKNTSARRIRNAIIRYNPTCVVCVTQFAHVVACQAKSLFKFSTPIICVVDKFTCENIYNIETAAYIVDNQEQKQALIRYGALSKDVLVMGLPYVALKKTQLEIETLKQNLGIPNTTTVLIDFRGKSVEMEIFNLLIDQGRICNVIAFVADSDLSKIRKIINEKGASNVQLITSVEDYDNYIAVADIIFTDSDAALISKGFQLGKPVCCYDPKNREELTFLLSKGLIVRAKEPIDIVDCLYALLETNKKDSLIQAGLKWVEFADISNIANYVCAYINTDD